ncbi:MAG: SAM-dependent methyltransferase, partial [Gammaproteobacteria bacterium]|nr:SAM-dependent methyltransferase [Gammaproteobacteria bacterium]
MPALPPEVLAHGERVLDHLCRCIEAAGGALDFADFMREALYAPGLGYYAAGLPKFGAAGDFVTAPEVSPLFGRALARQVAEMLERLGRGDLLEFGAGSGRLAVELLLELERLGRLPERYLILDLSASLRTVQRERLGAEAPHLLERVAWIEAWPKDFVGVIVGNEVLDALPVRILEIGEEGPVRLAVTLEEGRLVWTRVPTSDSDRAVLAEIETSRGEAFPPGYRVEFHPELPGWIVGLAHALRQGAAFLFDYGGSARELYAPERWMGTLRCHLRHHAHDDPLLHPG